MTIFGITISNKIIYTFVTILLCYLFICIDSFIVNKIVKNNKKNKSKHLTRSQNTVLILLKNAIKTILIIIAIITILNILGINTTALVTSIGAVSVIIGLALQDVLKDYLVGITIILESQFAIGEIVEINGFKGEVIYLGLKSTRIKALTGEVKIISNRNISEVINYSLNKTLLTFDICVSYEDDNDKVEKVLTDLANDLPNLVPEISEVVSMDGLNSLSDSCVIYRMSTLIRDRDKYLITRKVNKQIKKTLDENNIKIPYPQLEVHNEK